MSEAAGVMGEAGEPRMAEKVEGMADEGGRLADDEARGMADRQNALWMAGGNFVLARGDAASEEAKIGFGRSEDQEVRCLGHWLRG